MYGYHGNVLVVDLSTGASRHEPLPDDVLRAFIGGIGLGTYLLYRYCPQGADPLGPENPLVFVASPLTGTRLTTTSKFAVLAKSPLTGFIGDSLSSSFLALELKKVGADAVVITGRAPEPSLLLIDDGRIEVRSARGLLGLDTFETEAAVKRTLGRGWRVACIGPAGERLVRYASIANDGGRQAGRTGPGAIMGSKNLKAIAVRGSQSVVLADPGSIDTYARDLSRRSLGDATEKYRVLGTMANVAVFNRLGTLPTRNFQQATFEGAERVAGETLYQHHHAKDAHCANCTIGCEKILTTKDGGPEASARMEYESLFALGPLVGVDDPNVVVRAARACDAYGIDTISAGGTIAWAMECIQRGLLTKDDTSGLDLRFGNGEAVLACLDLIARHEGIGALLAEGSKRASERLGRGSQDFAMHVKGLEMPGYEPRSLKTMALGLAVSPRGACHNRSSAYEADFSADVDRLSADESRGAIAARSEDREAVLDSMIWCKFLRKAFRDIEAESALAYEWVTGHSMTVDELRRAGERIVTLKKLFNIREGWTRADDTLPRRALSEALSDGPAAGVGLTRAELDMMIDAYYQARGWTPDGLVPPEKIEALGLDALAPSLPGKGLGLG
ncbi:MAG: aldehyde ferredoxin oxidoreductase family protein [Chloroflexi bacterium]|nr:aldehyde ferredoxin oxidoreductase family protein [Chloroflexota bacterium]